MAVAFAAPVPVFERRTPVLTCTSRPTMQVTTPLLGEDVLVNASRCGMGTWSWGNTVLYQYDTSRDEEIQKSFNTAVSRGCSLIDTGDSYGAVDCRSEILIGRFLKECEVPTDKVVIATKLASYPWRLRRKSIVNAAEKSCSRLGRIIDLAQVHWSPSGYLPLQERVLLDGFADALEKGYARAIGLSNFGPKRLKAAADYLQRERGVRIASIQCQLSLLSQEPVQSGLIPVARERGIAVIGYSPLALGMLAGQTKPRGVVRDYLFNRILKNARPVQNELSRIASEIDCSQAQVAVAWALTKADHCLVGIRTERHALDAVDCERISLRLTSQHIASLEQAATQSPKMVRNAFQTD